MISSEETLLAMRDGSIPVEVTISWPDVAETTERILETDIQRTNGNILFGRDAYVLALFCWLMFDDRSAPTQKLDVAYRVPSPDMRLCTAVVGIRTHKFYLVLELQVLR